MPQFHVVEPFVQARVACLTPSLGYVRGRIITHREAHLRSLQQEAAAILPLGAHRTRYGLVDESKSQRQVPLRQLYL